MYLDWELFNIIYLYHIRLWKINFSIIIKVFRLNLNKLIQNLIAGRILNQFIERKIPQLQNKTSIKYIFNYI